MFARLFYKKYLTLLDRYILHQLFFALIALTGGAVALIWLTQSLHFVSMVVQHGLSLRAFLHLTSLLVPTLLGVILPISTFLVILFVYHKLTGDRELTVMRATGLSPLRLARPGLLCALCATGVAYFLSLWLSPASYHTFHRYEFQIRNRVAAFLLEEGVFTSVSDTMTIYVHKHETETLYKGVLIQDNRNHQKPTTIIAEEALIIPHNDTIHLVLYHGSRQTVDPNSKQLGVLDFSHDTIELTPSHSSNRTDQDAAEQPLRSLLWPSPQIPLQYQSKLIIEGWSRLITPLSTLSYAMIGLVCILRGRFSRHGSIVRLFMAVFCVVSLLLLSLMLKGIAARQLFFIPFLWINVLFPIGISSALLLQEQFKGRSSLLFLTKGKQS